MQYIQVTVEAAAEELDTLMWTLSLHGIEELIIFDPQDVRNMVGCTAPGPDTYDDDLLEQLDSSPSVTFFLLDDPQGRTVLDGVRKAVNHLAKVSAHRSHTMSTISVAEQDWAESWKRYFHPFDLGERLTICPPWEAAEPALGRVLLMIDPGAAFGTGLHATTQLCLLALERLHTVGARVLDMGCGSGILGIAASLLGAAQVTAVDVDPVALRITEENIALNNLHGRSMQLLCGDVLSDSSLAERVGPGYTLAFANIVSDVILAMRHFLFNCLAASGVLVVSGILDERAEEVLGALIATGFLLREKRSMDGWTALVVSRP